MTPSSGPPEPVEVSVVMACLNGMPHLVQQLDALAAEDPPFAWEVVVADNGSTDGTLDAIRGYMDRMNMAMVDASARRGQAFARNAGARRATGAKLIFVDHDDVVAPGYLAAMSAALDNAALVAARMDYDRLNNPEVRAARASSISDGLRPGLFPWAYACSLGARRTEFMAVAGFDEALPCAEDVDLCWRLQRDLGAHLSPAGGAVLHYRLKTGWRALFRQGLLYGKGAAALYRRWAAYGMPRRNVVAAARSWASILLRLLRDRDPGRPGEAWYLLGNRLGCLSGSLRERVFFL